LQKALKVKGPLIVSCLLCLKQLEQMQLVNIHALLFY